ncbi:RNA polymerase sigma factor sigB-like protein [Drosera capensis]
MSCLLPQFKWQPDSLSIHSKLLPQPHPSLLGKGRDALTVCGDVRGRCVASAAAVVAPVVMPTVESAAIQMERMRLQSLEGRESSVMAIPYFDQIVGSPEAKFQSTLVTETLIESEEAVIAAAAAEALALARAAAKYAKEAVIEAQRSELVRTEHKSTSVQSVNEELDFRSAQQLESEPCEIAQDFINFGTSLTEDSSLRDPVCGMGLLEPSNEELELLEAELFDGIAVRSNRQTERRARREKAAEKAEINIVPLKVHSPSRKKRTSSRKVNYNDPLHHFRGMASKFKLLTAKEEVELSNGIQDLLKLEKLKKELAEKCGGPPNYAQWAVAAGTDQKTLRKLVNHGIHCKERMVKSNIRLVISIAKKYQGLGLAMQDLVQEGCLGLIRGIEKFDPSRGFRFSTYAHWWIRQAVRRGLNDRARLIRIPYHVTEAAYKVKQARNMLYSENKKEPTDEELAQAAGITMKRLEAVKRIPKRTISLDQKVGTFDNVNATEILADPEQSNNEAFVTKLFKRLEVDKLLDSLTEREGEVMRGRFGMSDGRPQTLQELGESIGVSRERIRQIELTAVRKLKRNKRTEVLLDYMNS